MIHRGQFGEVAAIAPVFGNKTDGFYVDVGAQDGLTGSNTIHFMHLGWRGICIEPHRRFYPLLVKVRPRDICLNCAVWDEELESVDFYATEGGSWSRIGGPLPNADWPVVEIQHPRTRILDNILEEFQAPTSFDLLSIDVEGSEWHVLHGFTLAKYRPRIVIIEDLEQNRQFDSFFEGYVGVSPHYPKTGGPNVIYCREAADAEIVRQKWKRQI